MKTRIYVVTFAGKTRLVEAGSPAGALRYAVQKAGATVHAATPGEVATLLTTKTVEGVEVADATIHAAQADLI